SCCPNLRPDFQACPTIRNGQPQPKGTLGQEQYGARWSQLPPQREVSPKKAGGCKRILQPVVSVEPPVSGPFNVWPGSGGDSTLALSRKAVAEIRCRVAFGNFTWERCAKKRHGVAEPCRLFAGARMTGSQQSPKITPLKTQLHSDKMTGSMTYWLDLHRD